jgi:catechol 2,3-dioxygenase-like lactoylglutathione lyase family enzyme
MNQSYAKLPARDVERARAFYADRLNLTPFGEHDSHLFYEVGGSHFMVYPSSGAASGTHDQIGFAVENVEAMVSNVLRDAALDPIVQETMVSFYQYWETVRDVIADAFEASGERHAALLGAIALAQDFQTWRTLVRQQELSQDRAVELMVGMVRCLMRT